jgi:hypothetical protein
MQTADRKISGVDNPWESIPLPGGAEPASFFEGHGAFAYVISSDGGLFMQELEKYRKPATWEEVETVLLETELDARIAAGGCTPVDVGPHPHRRIEPPTTAIAQLNCLHHVNPEHTVDMIFVIQEDGDIQRWMWSSPGLAGLGIYLIDMGGGGIIGGALGLLLLGVMLVVRGRGKAERERYTAR